MRKFTYLFALLMLSVSSWATVIEWTSSDLETVNVEMGYNTAPGESQTIKGITVTNNTCYQCGDYCHFEFDNDPQALYCGFSMRDNGQLVFAPESGKLTSIVIHWNYEGPDPDLVPGSGWIFSESQLTWTSATVDGASSVVLKSNSSNYLASGPITLIEFTVSGFVPTTTTTWEVADLATINVGKENGAAIQDVNLSQTVKTITVTADASAPANEEYNGSSISGDIDNGGNLNIIGDGSLTFTAPEGYLLKKIVITGNGCNSGYSLVGSAYLPEGWLYNDGTCSLTWSGDATSSVELSCTDQVYGNINFSLIESIVFTVAEDVVVDTRKVPDLRVEWNYISEATIIKDMYGEVFEPGTSAMPKTSYPVYVYEDFYEPGIYTTKSPSELELPMTYSVTSNVPSIPNEDVITLTETSGNYIEFDYRDDYIHFGDAEITISTAGNEVYQPASITFTIHVIEGKATTRECVLSFDDGSIVPDDYEFNMETGEEFVNLTLRENNSYHSVYAPSFSIWGSKNYYVASLAGEKKLRALTAGTDTFTVQYARYETGDAEGKFKILKFPVHIKSSKPALTSSLVLTSSPASSSSLVCNAEYDGSAQSLKIKGALTNEEVKNAMRTYAYGSPEWKAALPNTISFELAAGEGDFSVTCQVLDDNYEVRVLMFGDAIARHYDNPTLETHNIHYNIATQKAVVIYVAEKTSPNNGPKRAPMAKQDAAPLAMLSALEMTPTYPISANVDPDHAGVYYSTIYNETQKYQLPAGTEAYVATVSGSGDLNMTKVADGGQVIPANTALILKSTSASVVLTPTDADAVTISADNQLQGTDSEMAAPANCFVLSGHSTDYSVTGVGFYHYTTGSTLAAHKAYLIYTGPTLAPAHRMRFIFNSPTGLENASMQVKSEKRIENGQLIIIRNGVKYNAAGQTIK